MSGRSSGGMRPTRRGLVRVAAGLAAAAGSGLGVGGVAQALVETRNGAQTAPDGSTAVEPFWGGHQGGIMTPAQGHTYFAALDLITTKRDDVTKLLQLWTKAAARMTAGQPAQPIGQDPTIPGPDTGEALGLPPARLTVTFGFGAGLFVKDGKDRYGLARSGPRRWSICPASTATNCSRPGPAAICRSRPAPTIRRSRFTPFANWRGSPMAWRSALGAGRFHRRFRPKADAAQPDGLQGRHQQSGGRRRRDDG